MNNIVILGAGGFARELMWLIESIGTWNIVGFVRNEEENEIRTLCGYQNYPNLESLFATWKNGNTDLHYCFGTGSPRIKRMMDAQAREKGLTPSSPLIHPDVRMHRSVKLGNNVVVCAGTILTIDITIGYGTMLNLNCTVGHDAVIGEYCTFNPGTHISGEVTIQDEVECGTNVSVIQGLTVGKGAVIGAGAAVVRSIPEGVTAVGVPAKPLKKDGNN